MGIRGRLWTVGLLVGLGGLAGCAPGMQVDPVDPAPAPDFAADTLLAPLGFDHVEMRVRRGRRIGSYRDGLECLDGGKDIWWGSGRVVSQDVEWGDLFHEQMTLAGYRVTGDPARLFRKALKGERAVYQVSGQIEDIRLNLCEVGGLLTGEKLGAQTGEGSVRVYWQVYSPILRKVVLEARSAGYFAVERPVASAADVLVREAFAEAVGNLAASPDLAALVRAPRPTRAEARQSQTGERLWLPSPPPPAATPAAALDTARRAVVAILPPGPGEAQGSGVVIAPGLVLTAYSVVEGAGLVDVRLPTGRVVPGEVLRFDDLAGVAVVRIDAVALPALALRRGAPPDPGAPVYALAGGPGTPVSHGVVSRHGGGPQGQAVFHTDTATPAGGSGGPLIDSEGRVVGIARAAPDQPPGQNTPANGTAYVPVTEALRALNLGIRHANDGRPAEGDGEAWEDGADDGNG